MKTLSTFILSVLFMTLPGKADRYDDLLARWFADHGNDNIPYATETDAMDLAWKWAPQVKARCYAYELLEEKVLMDKAADAVTAIMGNAVTTNPMGQKAFLITDPNSLSRWKNPDAAWWPGGVECSGESMLIIGAVLRWVYVVKKYPALSEYVTRADQYLAELKNDFLDDKWLKAFVDESRQEACDYRYRYAGTVPQLSCSTCGVDPYAEDYRDASSPHNKASDFGLAMLTLYDITGDPEYLDVITEQALNFKSKLIWLKNEGQWFYAWHYYDPTWLGDFRGVLGFQVKSGIWIEHRSGYGNINMTFAAECYRRGIVFGREDMDRFVRTNRDVMYNPGGDWFLSDGSVPNSGDYGGLFSALGPYDSTLGDMAYAGYDANVGAWGAKLGIPYFVHTMKLAGDGLHPPDTLGWVGPLEVTSVEPLDRGRVRLTFYHPVASASLVPEAFDFSRGIEAVAVTQESGDARTVTVQTTDQGAGNTIKLYVRGVQDTYGNETFAYPNANQPYVFTSSDLPAGVERGTESPRGIRGNVPGAATEFTLSGGPAPSGVRCVPGLYVHLRSDGSLAKKLILE